MTTQTDIFASAPLTSTGAFKSQGNVNTGRCRIKGYYYVSAAAIGSVILTAGNGGATLLTINTPTAANLGSYAQTLPGEGILSTTDVWGTVTNTTSFVIFYG